MAATTRILTLSLSSTTTTRLSFSLITFSNPYTPRRLLHGFRPISYSATATATEPSLESSKHSILLERLRIRYLKDFGETNTYKKSKLGFKESEIGESELKKDVNKIEKVLLGFNELGLGDKVLGALSEMGITVPTVIQSLGIPAVLDEKSVVLGSHTGSGKTLAYLLPLVQVI